LALHAHKPFARDPLLMGDFGRNHPSALLFQVVSGSSWSGVKQWQTDLTFFPTRNPDFHPPVKKNEETGGCQGIPVELSACSIFCAPL
jgi:hypothetical protein